MPWSKFSLRLLEFNRNSKYVRFSCFQVEKDAKKLVSQVCGANYVTGSDPILIKVRQETNFKFFSQHSFIPVIFQDDSEYPDWLWTINVKRPLPPLEEQDPNTKQYWMQVTLCQK